MTRRLTAKARRQQLVETAIGIAEASGVASIRLRDVAANAEVSLGTLHHFFPSKSELMSAVARTLTKYAEEAATAAGSFEAWNTTGVEGFHRLLENILERIWAAVKQKPQRRLVTYEMTTYALRTGNNSDDIRIIRDQYAANTSTAAEILQMIATSARVEWIIPIEQLATTVLAFFDGLVLRWLVDQDDNAAAVQRRLVADLLSHSVAVPGASVQRTPTPPIEDEAEAGVT